MATPLNAKGNGNCGCHIAGFLLGLSQSGKPRTSVVGPYQIQTAVDRTGRFHGLGASAREQSGRLEIYGLRALRLLPPGRNRSKMRAAQKVPAQNVAVSPRSRRSGSGAEKVL